MGRAQRYACQLSQKKCGDAILAVDNKPVSTVDEFEAAIKAVKDSGRNTALIKADRNGAVRFIGLPLNASN